MNEQGMIITAKGIIYMILKDAKKTNEIWEALREHGQRMIADDPDANIPLLALDERGGFFIGGSNHPLTGG